MVEKITPKPEPTTEEAAKPTSNVDATPQPRKPIFPSTRTVAPFTGYGKE